MSIIDELLEKWKKSEDDEKLRILCDQISIEEIPDPGKYEGPLGANIFLSLPITSPKLSTKYENYICIEREAEKKYIVSHWSCYANDKSIPKRVAAWDIKNDQPKKVLKEFIERMQFLKGE